MNTLLPNACRYDYKCTLILKSVDTPRSVNTCTCRHTLPIEGLYVFLNGCMKLYTGIEIFYTIDIITCLLPSVRVIYAYNAVITVPAQPAYTSGHYRPTSETPFEWRFTGGPTVIRFCVLTG